MSLAAREFRNALGCFATGITIITTVDDKGEVVGNTASSFNSVSLDPPMILWSLGRTAFSLTTYLKAEYFAVNVLRRGQEALSNQFARPGEHKFEAIDYETWRTGCPILPSALAVFECRMAHTYAGGDHVIFVGEVLASDFDPRAEPLVFFRGRYNKLAVDEEAR